MEIQTYTTEFDRYQTFFSKLNESIQFLKEADTSYLEELKYND